MVTKFRNQYYFLSNFYDCPVTYEGITYRNSEAAYQAQKTLDIEERKKFAEMTNKESKEAGQQLQIRPDWDDVKVDIMSKILIAKFGQNIDLMEQLLNTGCECLEEGNDWGDQFWGTVNGIGENNLGRCLMMVRELFFFIKAELIGNYGENWKHQMPNVMTSIEGVSCRELLAKT